MEHELKVWPAYFERLLDASKTFEIRRDDRGFQPGDRLILREWSPTGVTTLLGGIGGFTGRKVVRTVGFVAKGTIFGHALGEFAVLSLLPPVAERDPKACSCPLVDVTWNRGPEFIRGDPGGCPVHGAERDAEIAAAVEKARRA